MTVSAVKSIIIGSALSVCCLTPCVAKPLKVYLLAGQSNMTGIVSTRTFAHIKMCPETANEFKDLFDEDGSPLVLDNVYVSQWLEKEGGKLAPVYGGGRGERFGPDYAFGIYMHKKLNEPILIIKTSLGGRSLFHCFRPPSADAWIPSPGHPDLVKEVQPVKLPIPEKLDLPDDYVPGDEIAQPWRGRVGKFMGIRPMRGVPIGEVNGIHPLYITASPAQEFPGDPFLEGDLILGVNGAGLREDPIAQWRDAFHGSRTPDGDWMINVTRWRKGKITTFDFDIADLENIGGRENLAAYLAEVERKNREDPERAPGIYYRKMIDQVKTVLRDLKAHHPGYDEKAGYEIAGFVWFQGWNDMINSGVYPNRDKPRGYEKHTWLLEHLIRDVRNDLNAPDLPTVIGVLGVDGIEDPPTTFRGHFQQAQAAVAENPEFKGTVAVVQTGKYWDHELAEIDSRSREIRQQWSGIAHQQGLKGEAEKTAYQTYRAERITPAEEELLSKGVSDGGFHYLGSAKVMAGIGKAFAEAMIDLREKKQSALDIPPRR